MGRRSTNTTKSGKFMNPTDRARKEARRKELKKNKKQRMAVRQAVLKSKDAAMLLEEATIYDRQEYDPKSSSTLSDRVLQEKRKKLLETYDRMIMLYRKEDSDKATELQALRNDYDRKRNEMILYYDQVKLAEKVNANDIPLPDIPSETQLILSSYPGNIPLPPGLNIPPHPAVMAAAALASAIVPTKSILKKQPDQQIPGPPPGLPALHRKPCAPPPGTPDELSEAESDNDEEGEELSAPQTDGTDKKKIRFVDDDQYDPNTEVEKNTRLTVKKAVALIESNHPLPQMHIMPPPGFIPPNRIPVPTGIPPPIPVIGAPGFHPVPTSITMPPHIFSQSMKVTRPISTATTQSNTKKSSESNKKATMGTTTIEAKPQLKNLIGDSTKLVPTQLRVKKAVKPNKLSVVSGYKNELLSDRSREHITSKDDAYDQFMKEMEGLLMQHRRSRHAKSYNTNY